MKTVLFQGAFEILNYGHVRAIKTAKAQGDRLIIALNTNRLLKKYKGRDAVLPWKHKKTILMGLRWVDEVVPAHNFSPLSLLKRHDVDVYVISREWEASKAEEIAYMKAKGGRIHFSRDYSGVVRTSEIKKRLLAEAKSAKRG